MPSFATINNAIRNYQYISAELIVDGTTVGVIMPSGCEYAIDSGAGYGAFTTSAGTVLSGNKVKARIPSNASYSGTVTGTLTLNGIAFTFTVNTETLASINVTSWTKNSSSPIFDGAAINGGH